MFTADDKKYLEENFATKNEIITLSSDFSSLADEVAVLTTDVSILKTDVSILKTDVAILKNDVNELKDTTGRIEETMQKVLTIVTNFAGNVDTLQQENIMGAETLRRHDVQIHELAVATGTTLSE